MTKLIMLWWAACALGFAVRSQLQEYDEGWEYGIAAVMLVAIDTISYIFSG